MVTICAWCNKELTADTGEDDGGASHGICAECSENFLPHPGMLPFSKFLDGLAAPLLVVDDDVRIVAANDKAGSMLGKTVEELAGEYGGMAMECAHARLPGGCGKTVHCKSCTIRRTVQDTFATGRSHYDVPAYMDVNLPGNDIGPTRFLISTRKAGELVILKIAEVSNGQSRHAAADEAA